MGEGERVAGTAGADAESGDLCYSRSPRGFAAGGSRRTDGTGTPGRGPPCGGVLALQRSTRASLHGSILRTAGNEVIGMNFLQFMMTNRQQLLDLTLEHITLAGVAKLLAEPVGTPLGILITRFPQLSKPVARRPNIS